MAEKKLEGLRVAIIATDYFEEAELIEPRKALQEAGAKTVVIAPKAGEIQGLRHVDKGQKVKVDMTLDEAKPDDFDALLLPGGAVNADALRIEEKAQQFVQNFDQKGKPVGVICHGPWLLVSADLVEGRHLTSYKTIRDDLENAGATWTDEAVVQDKNWVSSRQPTDIPQFNRALIELYSQTLGKTHKAA